MHKDYMKHNEAVRYGWLILYFMSFDLTPKRMSRTIRYVHDTIKKKPSDVFPDENDKYQRIVDRLTKKD